MRPSNTLPASDITTEPDGGSLQIHLDKWTPSENRADLVRKLGPPSFGTFVVDRGIAIAEGIDLEGDNIELRAGGAVYTHGPNRTPLISDLDGPVVFGDGRMEGVLVVQNNMGASAKCVDISSTTSPPLFRRVGLQGIDPGIFSNCTRGLTLEDVFVRNAGEGTAALRLSGVIPTFDVRVLSVNSPGVPATPYLLLHLMADLVYFTGALNRCFLFSADPLDRMVRIDAAPAAATNTLLVEGCSVDGAAAGLLYHASGFDETDVEILATGGNGNKTAWQGEARTDTPNVFVHLDNEWEDMPTTGLAAAASNQRFVLDAGIMKGTGRTVNLRGTSNVSYSVDLKKTAGGPDRNVELRMVSSEDDGASWAEVPGSVGVIPLDSANAKQRSQATSMSFTDKTWFKPQTRSPSGITSSTFPDYQYSIGAS